MRALEAAAELTQVKGRFIHLPRDIIYDAQLHAGAPNHRVRGAMLTDEAARELSDMMDLDPTLKVRAIPLLSLLNTDHTWRQHWQDPMQLLRMQLVAVEVYFAALHGKSLPKPQRSHQLAFLRNKRQLELCRERHCWHQESEVSTQGKTRRAHGSHAATPPFSWLSQHPLAEARTRRPWICCNKGISDDGTTAH